MYALIATHNASLRSAIMVLLRICHPGCHLVLANDVADVHEVLESGRCDTMLVDTSFVGYGTTFTAEMLRDYYPSITFLPLGAAGGARGLIGQMEAQHEAALGAAGSDRGPARGHEEAAVQTPGTTSIGYLLKAIDMIGGSAMVAPTPEHLHAERPLPELARAEIARSEPTHTEYAPALTGRQRDVLRLLGEGRSTKDIARRLGLAVPTVKTHLAALYRQLGARNRVEAVVKASMPRDPRTGRLRPTMGARGGFFENSELVLSSAS
jgi:DNA-binding NarL/FixJ family response regulator